MARHRGEAMSAARRSRIAVFASGGGSNLGALLDHLDRSGDARVADVALVASNRASAGALARATARGIPAAVIDPAGGDIALHAVLAEHAIDLVVLAGYLRLVPPSVTSAYRGRVLNIHPALLPAFGGPGMYGERVHRSVIESGARISGATVHFVDDVYDSGPIIAQWPVPVLAGDTAAMLAARVLRAEHALLPPVVDAVAAGRIWLADDGRVEGFPMRAMGDDAGFAFDAHASGAAHGLDALLPPLDRV